MSWIVVVRMQGGSLIAITDGEDKLKEWPDADAASDDMEQHLLGPLGYEAIEVTS